MLGALVNVANLIVKLIAKSATDPDVQALAAALHALVAAHNAGPTPPPAA